MRKVIVGTFVSLDGVMQAPGGPDEDPTGGFKFGGWVAPHFDEKVGAAVDDLFNQSFDLLLGRRTYDIFAAYWPYQPTDPAAEGYDPGNAKITTSFNAATKYVATHNPGTLDWVNSKALGQDAMAGVAALKKTDGPDLVVQGSSELIHQLLKADLMDVIQLMVFPIVLGKGKRMFDSGSTPAGLKLVKSVISENGVLVVRYERAGEVPAGSFATQPPSDAELARRRTLS